MMTHITSTQTAIILALLANICFGLSCLVFATFTEKFGSGWVNLLKAIVSTLGFLLLWVCGYPDSIITSFMPTLQSPAVWYFFISGMLGLAIADLFLLKALRHNGVAQTLIFYAFQPFLLFIGAHFLWGEVLKPGQWLGVFVFCLCLFLFCIEKYQISRVKLNYALIALVAIILDSTGVLIAKIGYSTDINIHPVQACFLRGLGALFALGVYSIFNKIDFIKKFRSMDAAQLSSIMMAAFFGTFISLLLYLMAVQIGPLTLVSAVAVTTPIWATLFEFIYFRKRPTKIFLLCLFLYAATFSWNFYNS